MKSMEEKVMEMKKRVGNGLFTREQCRGITSIDTLKKYGYIEYVEETEVYEYELEDIAKMLNEWMDAGEMGWYVYDQNRAEEFKALDGRIYKFVTHYGYRFVK